MAAFDKSAVDVAELTPSELSRVVSALGFGDTLVGSQKLTNGGCAANYICDVGTKKIVVKAIVSESAEEAASLAADHLKVLRVLSPPAAPTAEPREHTPVPCQTATGGPAVAVGMSLLEGEAANILLRKGAVESPAVFAALGASLGTVHGVAPPDGLGDIASPGYIERYVRCGEGALEDHFEQWRSADSFGFIDWLSARLSTARQALSAKDLPRGMLHGDPFVDNVLINQLEGGKVSAALVDWEDSAIGPLVYDLAVAAAGGCFATQPCETETSPDDTPAAPLKLPEFQALLQSYSSIRQLSAAEAKVLRPLMIANAVMCACYRWFSFHVKEADAPASAKCAHLEMVAVVRALEDATTAEGVDKVAAQQSTA